MTKKKNTFTKSTPHGVCGTFEFYITTEKCVHCSRKHAAKRHQAEQDHSAGNPAAPRTDVRLAALWASRPIARGLAS